MSKARSECSIGSKSSHLNFSELKKEKTWRTYDGSSSSRPQYVKARSAPKVVDPSAPPAKRVQSIIVPRESIRQSTDDDCVKAETCERCVGSRRFERPHRAPCQPESSGKWKYIIALASAILIGFALKKYLTSG